MGRLAEHLHTFLHKIPAWVILVIPFAIFLAAVYTVSIIIPTVTANHYLFLFAIFVAVAVSRTVQLWEFGIQAYHFLLFWFAVVYGILPGIAMILLSYMVSLYTVFKIQKHYLNHSLFGTTVNTVALVGVVIAAGILGRFFPSFLYSNFVMVPLIICTISGLFEKTMANRFAGVDLGRLSASAVVEVMVNYNLFLFYTYAYLSLLQTL